MDLLQSMFGHQMGFAVAEFLSTNGDREFGFISNAFRQQMPDVRSNIGLAIGVLLHRRPESTTTSAKVIGIFVLYDAFLFNRVPEHHIFGPLFVVLLKNEALVRRTQQLMKPLGNLERTFLCYLLKAGTKNIERITPNQLIDSPQVMNEFIDAELYERRVISYAVRNLPILIDHVYRDDHMVAMMDELKLKAKEDYQEELRTIGDDMIVTGVEDEAYAFYLLYRQINVYMFPGHDVYRRGGFIRDPRYDRAYGDPYSLNGEALSDDACNSRKRLDWSASSGVNARSSSAAYKNGAADQLNGLTTSVASPIKRNAYEPLLSASDNDESDCLSADNEDQQELEEQPPKVDTGIKRAEGDAMVTPGHLDEVQRQLKSASEQTLTIGDQTELLQLLMQCNDDDLLTMVDVNVFEKLVTWNSSIAVHALCRFIGRGRMQSYLERMSAMPLSLNVLDVLSQVSMAMALPTDFLHSFLSGCYASLVNAASRNKGNALRMVKLVSTFTESLVVRKLIEASEIKCEALHFCMCFSDVGQALSLYRALTSECA